MNTRRLGRLAGAAVAVAGTVAAMSGCGLIGGSVPTAEVGTCANTEDLSSFTEFPSVDCDEEHDAEVFYKQDLEGDDFPGAEAVDEQAAEICNGDAFTDYVGVPYDQSEIYASWIPPNEDTWNDNDDREVLCILVTEQPVTGSLEGANR